MTQEARIKLTSTNLVMLENICQEIKGIGEKNGIKFKGPHPLPTKKMKVVTRKSPCGQNSIDYFFVMNRILVIPYEDRIHKEKESVYQDRI